MWVRGFSANAATKRNTMNVLDDTLRLIQSWRIYRRMYGDDALIVRNFALVIRSRIK